MKKIEEMTIEELIRKGDYFTALAEIAGTIKNAFMCASMATMYYSRALLAGCVTQNENRKVAFQVDEPYGCHMYCPHLDDGVSCEGCENGECNE